MAQPLSDLEGLRVDYATLHARTARLEYILRELSNGGWLKPVPAALRREAEDMVFKRDGMD